MFFTITIGALIGYFATHSLVGLLIGAGAGYYLPKLLKFGAVSTARKVRSPFVESTFAVMGAVCKADGRVSEEEIRVAERFFNQFHLHGQAREAAKQAFNRGKRSDFDLDAEIATFLRISRGQRVLHLIFLQVQLAAMAADGQIDDAERELLRRIARGLGIPESEIQRLEAMLNGRGGFSSGGFGGFGSSTGPGRPPPQRDLDAAYEVIGVKPSDSDATIKRAYRKLISENHPDKLAAKGLPESMREVAERKTREITAAYRTIEQARATA